MVISCRRIRFPRVLAIGRIDRRLPRTIKTDNGSEFISKVMDKWAYERGVPPTMK